MPKINMVRHEGGSRVISISKAIPETWKAVEIEVVKTSLKTVTVRFNRVK